MASTDRVTRISYDSGNGESLPRKGVVQTVSAEGWSWIKKDGNGSRKSGNRIPFSMADVVRKVRGFRFASLPGTLVTIYVFSRLRTYPFVTDSAMIPVLELLYLFYV